MEIFVIMFVLAIVGGIVGIAVNAANKTRIRNLIDSVQNFRADYKYIGEDGTSGIAIQESTRQVCLLRRVGGSMQCKIVSYRDIMSVELAEDGHTVTKTSRTSQAATALVGGLLFGGVGAAVGALTGSTRSKGKIKRVELRIVVNDSSDPVFVLCFQNVEAAAGGLVHRTATTNASEWVGRINVIIRQADEEDKRQAAEQAAAAALPQLGTLSKADELTKLAKLKSEGILTEEEFLAEKAKILAF